MKSKRKLLLIDIGDTLIYRKDSIRDLDKRLIKEYLTKLGLEFDSEELLCAFIQKEKLYPELYKPSSTNLSTVSLEENYSQQFLDRVVKALFPKHSVDHKLMKSLKKDQKRYLIFKATVDLAKDYVKKGYAIGLFSNGRPSRRSFLQELNLMELFDQDLVYISDEMGKSKPDIKAYEFIMEDLNKKGITDITFVDDEEENLQTALKVGWRCIKALKTTSYKMTFVPYLFTNQNENF